MVTSGDNFNGYKLGWRGLLAHLVDAGSDAANSSVQREPSSSHSKVIGPPRVDPAKTEQL